MPGPREFVQLESLPREEQLAWLSGSAGEVLSKATVASKVPLDLWRLCMYLLIHACPLMAPRPGVPCGLAIQTALALQQVGSLTAVIDELRAAAAADGLPQSRLERLQRLTYLLELLAGNQALLGHSALLPSANDSMEILEVAARLPFECKAVAVYVTDRGLEVGRRCWRTEVHAGSCRGLTVTCRSTDAWACSCG